MIIDPFLEIILKSKRSIIYIDDYNDFHETYRLSDFSDYSGFITHFLIHHYIPYYRTNLIPNINRLVDDDSRILIITTEDLGYNYPSSVDTVLFNEINNINFQDYDLIINMADNNIQSDPRGIWCNSGIDEKIQSGKIKLNNECIFISYKSSRVLDQPILDMFSLCLKQGDSRQLSPDEKVETYLGNKVSFGILEFKSTKESKIKDSVEMIYGPWPLHHVDFTWKTFPYWPTVSDLTKKSK